MYPSGCSLQPWLAKRIQLQPSAPQNSVNSPLCWICCVVLGADDNFDWATATGTWLIDIFAPWSVPVPVLTAILGDSGITQLLAPRDLSRTHVLTEIQGLCSSCSASMQHAASSCQLPGQLHCDDSPLRHADSPVPLAPSASKCGVRAAASDISSKPCGSSSRALVSLNPRTNCTALGAAAVPQVLPLPADGAHVACTGH